MKILLQATTAEEVFGHVENHIDLKAKYRELCLLVHPDRNKTPEATSAFERLTELYNYAKLLFEDGRYGKRIPIGGTQVIQFGKKKIDNIVPFLKGKIADVKTGILDGEKVIIKISRNPADNDLLLQESRAYQKIDEYVKGKPIEKARNNHIGKLLHTFMFGDRRVNVLKFYEKTVTLESVLGRVDAQSTVWIWKRMMAALSICHSAGVIHNAVLPDNFLIDTENHNGILIDFCYSTFDKPKIIDVEYRGFYAPEVLAKEKLDDRADIFLAGNTIRKVCNNLPKRLDSLAKACILKHGRLNSAQETYKDIDEAALALYGKPKFHPFQLI